MPTGVFKENSDLSAILKNIVDVEFGKPVGRLDVRSQIESQHFVTTATVSRGQERDEPLKALFIMT